MNNWTSLDELVQNLIAVAIVGVTLFLEVASVFNDFKVPVNLELASLAVLVAYGYKVVKPTKPAKPSP